MNSYDNYKSIRQISQWKHASKRIIYMLISIVIDTKNRRSYNESKSPGQKRKGAILMEQQKMLMEKMLQTLEQLSMEDLRKVYAFIRALLEIRHE